MTLHTVNEARHHLMQTEMAHWREDNLFSGHWWFILIINLLFFLMFIVLIDRSRFIMSAFCLLFSFFLVALVNEVGNYFGYWSYPYQFLGFLESFNAVDFMTIPVVFALIYQYFTKWMAYLITLLLVSALIGFVGMPIFVHFQFYELHQWNPFSSFVLLFIVGLVIKWMCDFIAARDTIVR